jgi:HAMP domain-containing protein
MPQRLAWLAPLMFLINPWRTWAWPLPPSQLNLRPDLTDRDGPVWSGFLALNIALAALALTIATHWPSPRIAPRAANMPLAMPGNSLLAWFLVAAVAFALALMAGACLAWLVTRSIAQPLETLEAATTALRDGHYGTRISVNTTDEIGAVTEGFNLMAERRARTHTALPGRNGDLTQALNGVIFQADQPAHMLQQRCRRRWR